MELLFFAVMVIFAVIFAFFLSSVIIYLIDQDIKRTKKRRL